MKIIIINLIFLTISAAQGIESEILEHDQNLPSNEALLEGEVVNDGDKTSGSVGDLIDGVESVNKAKNAYNNSVKAGNAASNADKTEEKLNEAWDNGIDIDVWDKTKNYLIQYKNSKQSFLAMINDITKKIAKSLEATHKRVNMWRTTETTLINYGKAMAKMANNTVSVFAEFQVSDLYDIDRKWSRKMEGQIRQNKHIVYGFSSYLDARYQDLVDLENHWDKLFFDTKYEEIVATDPRAQEAMLELQPMINEYRMIPMNTIANAYNALQSIRDINKISHGPSDNDPTMTVEVSKHDKMLLMLINKKQTYKDAKHLSALIASERAGNQVRMNELKQIRSNLQIKFTRLLVRKFERKANELETVNTTLRNIVLGGPLPTVDEHRQEVYGETSPGGSNP